MQPPMAVKEIQEVKYLATVYYAVYQCFQSAIDHLDYHLRRHAENDPKIAHQTNNPSFEKKCIQLL